MGFSAEWLSLREPADHAARNPDLLRRAAQCVGPGQVVLDLGSGTGSTLRAFAALQGPALRWRLLDNDPALLEVAGGLQPGTERILGNLNDIDFLPLDDVGLVSASALLDLMPRAWVAALADRLAARGIPFYAALSYDGVMRWKPPHEADASITTYFNAHQRSDKGIGTALGPDAGAAAAEAFRAVGFAVTVADSPWILGPEQDALHRELVRGIGMAAAEAGYDAADDWITTRSLSAPLTEGVIGHCDMLAIPGAGGT